MTRRDDWTAGWSAEKVKGHSEVLSTEPITGNALKIQTKKSKGLILIATLSVDCVRRDDLAEVHLNRDVVFAMNVPKNAVYHGSAISYADTNSFGIGGLGDLFVAIKVLALNEYDLTADAVRTGIDSHGKCSIILTSNPNCRPSGESIRAADSAGAKVLSWGELLCALNYAK